MRNLFGSLLMFSLLVACDAPQRARTPLSVIDSNKYQDGFGPGNNQGSTTGSPNTGGTTGSSTPPSSEPGFENCDLSDRFHSTDLGYFGICQSSQDETRIKFKPSLTNTSSRTCLIPTYKDASGSSTYLGQAQCTYTQQNVPITGSLYKNRSGFQTWPINGVIVMRENLINGYFTCMNAYASYVSQACPYGARTNYTCEQYAIAYRDKICGDFKTRYGNAYVDVRLK